MRGRARAKTVTTATVAEVCPDGKESNPESRDGHHCHPPECVRRGLGRPMTCFSVLTTSATTPCARRLSKASRVSACRLSNSPVAPITRLIATSVPPLPSFSPRSPTRCQAARLWERRNQRIGMSMCRSVAKDPSRASVDKRTAHPEGRAGGGIGCATQGAADPSPVSVMEPNRRGRR
ncbi:MAG: hypothetical protein UZ03_NOB001003461 [Nitrospira sp. OLB3]|nr:MAG: hypothetical protein UZ03_NOB001003461 [Nitrospira sp. OLB3]